MPFVTALTRSVGLILVGLAFIAAPMAALKLIVQPMIDGAIGTTIPTSIVHPFAMLTVMTLGYLAYVTLIERRAPAELMFRPAQAVVGLASGIGLIGVPMLMLYAGGFYHLLSYIGASAIWSAVPILLAAAVLEEFAFRGVIFGVLERQFGLPIALVSQAFLFGAVHMSNSGFTQLIDLVAVILIGAMWTLLFAYWRSIWSIALHHAVWNLTIVVSGITLSGLDDFRSSAVFRSVVDGPRLMTGGDAGPESSVVTLAVVIVAIVVVWLLVQRRGGAAS